MPLRFRNCEFCPASTNSTFPALTRGSSPIGPVPSVLAMFSVSFRLFCGTLCLLLLIIIIFSCAACFRSAIDRVEGFRRLRLLGQEFPEEPPARVRSGLFFRTPPRVSAREDALLCSAALRCKVLLKKIPRTRSFLRRKRRFDFSLTLFFNSFTPLLLIVCEKRGVCFNLSNFSPSLCCFT